MTTPDSTKTPTPRTLSRVPSQQRSSPLRGLRITFKGVLCFTITVLLGAGALNSDANLLLLLFGVSIGLFLSSALAAVHMVGRVEVERIMPQAVVANRPYTFVYVVRNRRRWFGAWSLTVGEIPAAERVCFPSGFITLLRPQQEQRVEQVGLCTHRDRIHLKGIRVTSRFPLRLFSCSVDMEMPGELVVYPAVGRVRRDIWRYHDHSGLASSRQRREHHQDEEFYGVREYREGDNPKLVYWRRSARTGQLIVREHATVRATQIIVIVDPWPGQLTGTKDTTRLDAAVEHMISVAATAVCDGIERGHRVGLIGRACTPVVIAPAGGRPQRQRLLHQLALLTPPAKEGLDELVAHIRWAHGWQARCLLCTTQLGPTHDRVVRFLNRRAEAVTIVSSESETLDKLFDMASETPRERRSG